jgi:hypothetical protein
MSVMLGGAAAGQEQQGLDQGHDSAAASPKPHLDDVLSLLECGLQLPPCLSARGNRTQAAGADVEPAAEQQQQQAALSHAASGSIFSVADVDTAAADWECDMFLPLPPSASPRAQAVDSCDAGQQEQQQQEQQPHSQEQQQQVNQQQQVACMDAEVRSSMLEVLLQQFRWSSAASAAAAAAALPGNEASGAGSLGEDGRTCGVCLDAVPTACILPCKHNMCGESC